MSAQPTQPPRSAVSLDDVSATLLSCRSRVEDVLNDGGVREWITFAGHIAWDTVRTSGTLIATGGSHDAVSLLGLREGDAAHGGLEHATVTVDLVIAAAGLVLGFGGWYAYFAILSLYVS